MSLLSAAPKAMAATLALALVATSLPSTASADRWHKRGWDRPHHGGYYERRRDDAGAALAAGVIGLAAGAIIGSALAPAPVYAAPPPPRPVYVAPRPVYVAPPPVYEAPAPVYRAPLRRSGNPLVVYEDTAGRGYAPEPWTPEWYVYCKSKYRSFDERSGTFQPYEGPRRLCR
ncbi:BA14K family protein [Afifella pfennigii]|uniref:BA14K family protein n=1 Tax=Afifella pfennigii TaxID=209897 RepID=UPI00047A2427|nr:BA14K family protein [Afifella pfennigii]